MNPLNPNPQCPKSQHGLASPCNFKFDLRERTFDFGVSVVEFVNSLPNSIGFEIKSQLLRAGTSVGANIEEADDASSRKDYAYKTNIARREAKETRYWLMILIKSGLISNNNHIKGLEILLDEVKQLIKILSSILLNFK